MAGSTEDGKSPSTKRRRLTWKEMFTTPKGARRNRLAEAFIVVAIIFMLGVTVLQAFGYLPHTPKTARNNPIANHPFNEPWSQPAKPESGQ